MRPAIGIIAADGSVDNITGILPQIQESCVPTLLSYGSLRHLLRLYDDHAHTFDGLLFSGPLPLQYINRERGRIYRPTGYFDVMDRDYYKLAASLLYQYPDVPVSRISLEPPAVEVDFTSIFGDPHPFYLMNRPDIDQLQREHDIYSGRIYDELLAFYLEQWELGAFDVVASRVTNLAEPMAAAGIPFVPILPSAASMVDAVNALVAKIQTQYLTRHMAAVGIVSPQGRLGREQRDLLAESLARYNTEGGTLFLLHEAGGDYELTTSNEALEDMTQGYITCSLSKYLREQTAIPLCVGWGVGRDAVEARRHAEKALSESRRSARRYAYLVTENQELIGPLAVGKAVFLGAAAGDAAVGAAAKRIGVAQINLQKLYSVQRKRGVRQFTSESLAFYLNITTRSANRILLRLAEHGAASVTGTEQAAVRGRPAKVYDIDLSKLI